MTDGERCEESASGDTSGDAELEQGSKHGAVSEKGPKRLTPPVRITVHHYRNRLIDYDNLCIKAVLDGIVRAGILADDTPEQIEEITHKQYKSKTEKTIVEIEEIGCTKE